MNNNAKGFSIYSLITLFKNGFLNYYLVNESTAGADASVVAVYGMTCTLAYLALLGTIIILALDLYIKFTCAKSRK